MQNAILFGGMRTSQNGGLAQAGQQAYFSVLNENIYISETFPDCLNNADTCDTLPFPASALSSCWGLSH